MTIYNILFPFLILVVLGVVIYILTKHLPEAAQQHEILEKEEKKRWWQVLLGKGENVLRTLRVLLLKIDNRLNNSIKKVRERKEEMGKGLKEYRNHRKHKSFQEEIPVDKDDDVQEMPAESHIVKKSFWGKKTLTDTADQETDQIVGPSGQDEQTEVIKTNKFEGFARKVSSVFRSSKEKQAGESQKKAVEEIIKKTFTPIELKVEKEQYWKKKEEMLIQSIVREPKNVGLYIQLGRLYSNQHNWKDARNAFLEVTKLDKTNVKAKEELKRIDKYLND